MENWLLTIIVFIPLGGAFFVLLSPSESHSAIRRISLWTMVADLLLGIVLFFQFDPNLYTMQFTELKARWFEIGGLTINYSVGMDGISFLLVELTLLLGPVVILSSWSAIEERVKEYHILLLVLQTGMIGAFVALDFFLFYVFWELMLIPMYFLIGIWGGGRKIYAAIKFFLFTMAGSVLMLVAIVYVVIQPELRTFDVVAITNSLAEHPLRPDLQILLFAAFAVAFAIKVPMFPFHTWLPDAHVEAPTAGSVILAGVLLKMGTYGFIRFAMPLFPYAVYESMIVVMVLALIGIIYGALVSMMQDDVKKLVAYSSVSHLGFVMLGLFALTSEGVQGALIQM
ncbi:MAG: NADH-quinone oxidoreductase subunit M, partial [Deltaproteobacteria bacterium]|nr:NADH-quinone oxidoreductase subunit M [Deltaproteobacteria bacterium]